MSTFLNLERSIYFGTSAAAGAKTGADGISAAFWEGTRGGAPWALFWRPS